jgi:phage FluMu protein Com
MGAERPAAGWRCATRSSTAPGEARRAVAVATIIQTQIRCAGCDRRLADLVNEVEAGQLIVELKCPRCGSSHLEIIRPPAPSGSLKQ